MDKVDIRLKDTCEELDGKPVCKECNDRNILSFQCARCSEDFVIDSEADMEWGFFPNQPDYKYCASCWEEEMDEHRWCECGDHFVDRDDFWADWFADCKNCASEKEFEEAKKDYEEEEVSG
jgi:hypothetical protein